MLDKLFNPESIAIIGASSDKNKVGHRILYNLIKYGYKGKIYPINPKSPEILSKKAYPSPGNIPDRIDLAIIAIPAKGVLSAIKECVPKGIQVAIVISSGFKEIGKDGAVLERELIDNIKELGIRVVGPNCLGIINTAIGLNATFAADMPPCGKIAFFSQSGALCTTILDWAIEKNIGFSKFISLGNKADLTEIEFIEFLSKDEETNVILGYIEGIENGQRFIHIAREATKNKPIILIKAGGTKAGARAASSHTGTLAGSDVVYHAAFRQSGILKADTVEEIFNYALAFASQPIIRGSKIAIITNAGGPGIIAADACERAGLEIPSISHKTVEELRNKLPSTASIYNPIDILGDAKADRYKTAMEGIVNDPVIDGILVVLTPQAMTDIEESAEIISSYTDISIPVFTSFMGGISIKRGVEVLQRNNIPNYDYPEKAIASFKKMAEYSAWQESPEGSITSFNNIDIGKVKEVISYARAKNQLLLSEIGTRNILEAYGFKLPINILAATSGEAVLAAEKIGYPVVMKIASPDILHKTDVGGIKVGITDKNEVKRAFIEITNNARRYMPEALIWGVLIQEMVRGGKEVILGINYDPQFGPVLMFGAGGIYVEVLKDVTFRVAPVTCEEADDMIKGIRLYPLLKGVRGESPSDIKGIADAICRISQLAVDFPDIIEFDINPLIVRGEGEGAIAIDARCSIRG
ncbi:MAG: acetate--CoA ligase alpha subunit [Nitrospirota bacterium]